MSVRAALREIAARPVPETQHYDPTDVAALMTPRPTPEPTPGTLVKPARKPRGPSKKLQALLADAEHKGYADAMTRDRGAEMLGIFAWMVLCFAAGFGAGVWAF